MSEPLTSSPADGPIRFVGHYYDNLMPWKGVGNSARFEIRPAAVPWMGIAFCNFVFVCFFFGGIYLGLRYGRPDERVFMLVVVIAIGVMTCAMYTGLTLYRFRGGDPWLVFDAEKGSVSLPREKREFPVGEVRLQWLFLVGWQSGVNVGSELQFVWKGPDGEETFLLFTSEFRPTDFPVSGGVFDLMLRKVKQYTPIEVVCIAMADRNTPRERRPFDA